MSLLFLIARAGQDITLKGSVCPVGPATTAKPPMYRLIIYKGAHVLVTLNRARSAAETSSLGSDGGDGTILGRREFARPSPWHPQAPPLARLAARQPRAGLGPVA